MGTGGKVMGEKGRKWTGIGWIRCEMKSGSSECMYNVHTFATTATTLYIVHCTGGQGRKWDLQEEGEGRD